MKRLADLRFDHREEVDVMENTLQLTSYFLFGLPSMIDD